MEYVSFAVTDSQSGFTRPGPFVSHRTLLAFPPRDAPNKARGISGTKQCEVSICCQDSNLSVSETQKDADFARAAGTRRKEITRERSATPIDKDTVITHTYHAHGTHVHLAADHIQAARHSGIVIFGRT